jgi:peptidoglycan biosynthesis protein MviN/MurJ (putative lipid II flippase)
VREAAEEAPTEIRGPRTGIVVGGIAVALAVSVQAYLSVKFATAKGGWYPSPGWELLWGLVLGFMAPVAGVVVWRIDRRTDRTTADRIERIEWVSGAVAVVLIFGTYMWLFIHGIY